MEACIAAGVGGEGFAVDAGVIEADANKHRSIPGFEWQKTGDRQTASRAMQEYLATLDDTACEAVFLFVLFTAVREAVLGPSVWTGRALQAENKGLEKVGLAHLYPAY